MYSKNLNNDTQHMPHSNMRSTYQGPSSSTAPSLTGFGARPNSAGYKHDSGRKSYTPSNQGDTDSRGEDIRSKLQRYKQEREDFEKVR